MELKQNKGRTKVLNAIQLAFDQCKVFDFDNKKWVELPIKTLAQMTSISERQCKRIVHYLVEQEVVLPRKFNARLGQHAISYALNNRLVKKYFALEKQKTNTIRIAKDIPIKILEAVRRMNLRASASVEDLLNALHSDKNKKCHQPKNVTFFYNTIPPTGVLTITSEETLNNFEKKTISTKYPKIEDRIFSTSGKNIPQQMLEIYIETMGDPVKMTKQLAQWLNGAFKFKFSYQLDQWRAYLLEAKKSGFLMGKVKSYFKAKIHWLLRFDVIARVLAGDFYDGKGSIEAQQESRPSGRDEEYLELELQIQGEGIEREFREKALESVGEKSYISYIQDSKVLFDGENITIFVRNNFVLNYIKENLLDRIHKNYKKGVFVCYEAVEFCY